MAEIDGYRFRHKIPKQGGSMWRFSGLVAFFRVSLFSIACFHPSFAFDPGAPVRMNVVSYNIQYARFEGVKGIVNTVLPMKPDIVGFQEIDSNTSRVGSAGTLPVYKGNMNAQFADELKLPYHKYGGLYRFDGGLYGNSTVSRYPIVNAYNVRLPGYENSRSWSAVDINFKNDKNAPVDFTFASVHFHHDNQAYKDQSPDLIEAEVRKILARDPGRPFMMVGDFLPHGFPGNRPCPRH
jgi:endonuclease/exonuclease/phosphatase family metal-dependent hydrolase